MQESGQKSARLDIRYWDGVNSTVQHTIAKKTELSHAENARAPLVGILEKRRGQAKKGTAVGGFEFLSTNNWGLERFPVSPSNLEGMFRVSSSSEPNATLSLSVFDDVFITESKISGSFSSPTYSLGEDSNTYLVKVADYVRLSEPTFFSRFDTATFYIDGTSEASSIYTLSTADTWNLLADADAQNIIGAQCDFAPTDIGLVMVNQKDYNRMIGTDGATVTTSLDTGSLYNSPRAARSAFYKNRMYLGDFVRNGVRYKTSVIRSSYPMGIIALVNGDHTSHASGSDLNVTDTKYFYSDSGVNTYDIYRGGTLIKTVTVTVVKETAVTITFSGGATTFESADEIWISGTYNGAKQYRWVNNPTSIGQDVKQYDTFKLAGGDEEELTLFEPVGNVLMIGNKSSLMTWNDYTLEGFDLGVGCVSKNGFVKLLGTLFFLHYSGVYSTTGGMPKLISRKVERYISGATKSGLENAAAGVKGLSVFFAIGDVTLYNNDGSYWKTLRDTCLEYDISDNNWYVHTNVPTKEFQSFMDHLGVERLLIEHEGTGKFVKEFLANDTNTDDGAEIFFRADTQELQLIKEFEVYGALLSVVTETERGTSLDIFVGLDDAEFYEIEGTVTKGFSILKINSEDASKTKPVLCRKVRISYRDSSKQICRISQMAVVYLPTTMDTVPE